MYVYDQQRWQSLFQTAVLGVVEQGELSYDKVRCSCMYRTRNGKRCGVGQLIADSAYSKAMEGLSVEQLAFRGLLPDELVPFVNPLKDLQKIHDQAVFYLKDSGIPGFIRRAERYATSHGIQMPVLPSTKLSIE